MIDELAMIYSSRWEINEWIHINIPTLSQISEYGEREYYSLISSLCATPSDFKVQLLDEFGINYEDMDDFEFFVLMCGSLTLKSTQIIFGENINISEFLVHHCDHANDFYIQNFNGVVIDRNIYTLITGYLRKIHGYKKNVDIAGNEHTRQYLIDKDRRALQRSRSKPFTSGLFPMISSLVSYSGFKYDYDTIWDLNIYRFMDSVMRINKYISYRNLMSGIYSGIVDGNKVNSEKLNWMASLGES